MMLIYGFMDLMRVYLLILDFVYGYWNFYYVFKIMLWLVLNGYNCFDIIKS